MFDKQVSVDNSFFELFSLAQIDALTEREQSLLELRYGLAGEDPCTLEQVAQAYGLSRERIRQLVGRSIRKIRQRGRREITKENATASCALLLSYVTRICKPNESGYLERIVTFAQDELAYLPQATNALPLLISLLFTEAEAKQITTEVVRTYATLNAAQVHGPKAEKLVTELSYLLTDIFWPRQRQTNINLLQNLINVHLERTSTANEAGIANSFFSQKMNREVHYRSLLELRMLQRLEAAEVVESYQEQPFLITEEAYGEERTYRPDIFFTLKDGGGVIAEINSWTHMALRRNLVKYETIRVFCLKNGLGLLITDGRKTFRQIRCQAIPSNFQEALLAAIAQSPTQSLSWSEYRPIRDHYAASWMDFLAIILANRLTWSLQPFTLRK